MGRKNEEKEFNRSMHSNSTNNNKFRQEEEESVTLLWVEKVLVPQPLLLVSNPLLIPVKLLWLALWFHLGAQLEFHLHNLHHQPTQPLLLLQPRITPTTPLPSQNRDGVPHADKLSNALSKALTLHFTGPVPCNVNWGGSFREVTSPNLPPFGDGAEHLIPPMFVGPPMK